MITQELRDLLAEGKVPPVAPAPPTAKRVTDGAPLKVNASAPPIRLRRDGQRPLTFGGHLLFQSIGTWSHYSACHEHCMSFYLSDQQTLVVALMLSPEPKTEQRPVYWAMLVEDLQCFERILDRWCQQVLTDVVTPDPISGSPDTQAALNAMTARSLRLPPPHSERNELCLQ